MQDAVKSFRGIVGDLEEGRKITSALCTLIVPDSVSAL